MSSDTEVGSGADGAVALAVVSHSAQIAAGAAQLAAQVAGGRAPVVGIGGAVDGALGTDGERVLHELRALAARGPVVVLVDIGSSLLAVRAALARLGAGARARTLLADAPLVEGAVAAAVAAAAGADAEQVRDAAEEARGAVKL